MTMPLHVTKILKITAFIAACGAIILVILYEWLVGLDAWALVRIPSLTVTGTLLVIGLVFGPYGSCAPWRGLARKFPTLFQKYMMPDLNGTWIAVMSSNWPRIVCQQTGIFEQGQADSPHAGAAPTMTLADLAEKQNMPEKYISNIREVAEQIGIDAPLSSPIYEIEEVPPHIVESRFNIKASAFFLGLHGNTRDAKGRSNTITGTIEKDCNDHSGERYNIFYVFEQNTPNPAATDENRHFGTAWLVWGLSNPNRLDGQYWTHRMWEKGYNTAGNLVLYRLDTRHRSDPSEDMLAESESDRTERWKEMRREILAPFIRKLSQRSNGPDSPS